MRSPVRARIVPVIVALGLALAACGAQQTSPSASGGGSGQPSSNATGGTVRVGIGGAPDSLNPGLGELSEAYVLYELIYDTPISISNEGKYEPELAKSWTVSDDGKTWTVELVDNAKFHDGTPLTSEDVKFTLELYRDTEEFPYLSSYPDVFEKIDAPDATHLVIHLSDPVGNFEYRMAFMYVLPKHIWENVDATSFKNAEMIGSGPFKLVENKRGQFTRLAANTDYWNGPPHVDGVIFQTIKNADARVAALTNGDVDMVTEFPPTAVPALQNAENVKLAITDPVAGSLRDVFFNLVDPADCPPKDADVPGKCTGHPALRDLAVRKALAMAMDKEQIISVAQLGLATPGLTLVPVGLGAFYASEVSDYAFDPDAANAALDAAGYKDTDGDGIRECLATQDCPTGDLTFRFFYPTDIDTAPREAQLLEGMWQAIGVKLQVQGIDSDTLIPVCCPGFDYDIILWGWGSDPDPAFLLGVPLCTEVDTGFNETGYCNPSYDALYEQQGVETDYSTRVGILHQMQQVLVDDVVYLVPYYQKQLQAYRTDRYTGWYGGATSWGLEDPSSLAFIRPVQ
jgi:peptide/nickel transport system substrate-binding protein